MATNFIVKLYLRTLVLFIWMVSSPFGQNSLNCDAPPVDASGYRCGRGSKSQCGTFAVLFTNSYYSSPFNLSFYLGINQVVVAEINGFSADTEFLPMNQPLLIPIDCKCNGGFFQAELTKTAIKGESFYSIAESLEGLTNCRAIKEKNPGVPPTGLAGSVRVLIPMRSGCLKCGQNPISIEGKDHRFIKNNKFSIDMRSFVKTHGSLGLRWTITKSSDCPSSNAPKPRLLISYPVRQGDTVFNIATIFNTTPEAIISVNGGSVAALSTLLIPVNREPIFGSLAKPHEPDLHFPAIDRKKTAKMLHIGVYIAIGGVILGLSIAVAAAFLVIKLKKKKQRKKKQSETGDMELQQLSHSVRTTSDKKFSFEGSQDPFENQILEPNASKILISTYTVDEIKRATENFNPSNQIEGSVYHGRLDGKNLAIKRTDRETISRIEFSLLHAIKHPSILRLLGTCLSEDSHSFLLFDYAKNGSLKDWLHGGLAMKNQFIVSCDCFLTWSQRLRICLDVAAGLQYMHHIMKPVYVHRNIKSRNIFLDEEFNAKIGNFGMARCVQNDIENPQFCSLGYLAPEYIHQGIISPPIDIFAFGVVLLEILSGNTPITRPDGDGGGGVRLMEKIKSMIQSENAEEELREWMDSALGESYPFEGAVKLAKLARDCVEEDHSLRPNAAEVYEKLSRLVEELAEGENTASCESSTKPLVKGLQASQTNP